MPKETSKPIGSDHLQLSPIEVIVSASHETERLAAARRIRNHKELSESLVNNDRIPVSFAGSEAGMVATVRADSGRFGLD